MYHAIDKKKNHHLWGIRRPRIIADDSFASYVRGSWEYIKECPPDRRAILKLNIRDFSQLEVREEGTGRTVLYFNCDLPPKES